MASAAYIAVREAILKKMQVTATYNGYPREMCPHCIGINKDGGEQALFYQFAGASSSGLPPEGEWRCIPLAQLQAIVVRAGDWHTGTSHKKPQTCVKQIDVEVTA